MPQPAKQWNLPPDPEDAETAGLPADLPRGLAQVLLARGINSREKLRFFLEPPHRLPYCPLRLSGMEPALQRLHRAIVGVEETGAAGEGKETVGIVGDFDVDGVTGTAILTEGLADFGVAAIPYLPHRVTEGHGLSADAVNLLGEQGATLLITVDCGVSSNTEVALARQRGIDVIITDHHVPPADAPEAVAIINPRMPGNEYPYPELCGAGLAFKLMQGLYQRHGRPTPRRLLELAALGTIADLVPLRDENRYLVREGLQELARTQRPGLCALYQLAGIQASAIDAETVSFQIAPRINSPGRMGHARDSLSLLTTHCPEEAANLAERLEELNLERRELTQQVYAAAQADVESRENLPPIILVTNPQLTPGVAGLVAGRLAESFHRPAIALASIDESDGDNLMASGRSIPAFNLVKAFTACADLFVRYGGHAQAGGFTIAKENLPLLEQRLTAIAGEILDESDLQPVLSIDAEINLADLTPYFLNRLAQLEPFGPENQQPVFLSRKLQVIEARRIGNRNQHLKLQVRQGKRRYLALAFNRAEEWDDGASTIDLAYSIRVDYWRGVKRVNLMVADFRPAESRRT
jgi:single-stranded-DNA-specific exonuclease